MNFLRIYYHYYPPLQTLIINLMTNEEFGHERAHSDGYTTTEATAVMDSRPSTADRHRHLYFLSHSLFIFFFFPPVFRQPMNQQRFTGPAARAIFTTLPRPSAAGRGTGGRFRPIGSAGGRAGGLAGRQDEGQKGRRAGGRAGGTVSAADECAVAHNVHAGCAGRA